MYSIALIAITAAAAAKGDLREGIHFLSEPGTYDQVQQGIPLEDRTWSVAAKCSIMVLYSTMGFFGSSCSAAITKNFGALSMSITSTARKATTLFLSFFIFNNICTLEHVSGIVLFIAALTTKSLRRGRAKTKKKKKKRVKKLNHIHVVDDDDDDMLPGRREDHNQNNGTTSNHHHHHKNSSTTQSSSLLDQQQLTQRLVLRTPGNSIEQQQRLRGAGMNSDDGSSIGSGTPATNKRRPYNHNSPAHLVHIV
jgi:hypothetical protein